MEKVSFICNPIRTNLECNKKKRELFVFSLGSFRVLACALELECLRELGDKSPPRKTARNGNLLRSLVPCQDGTPQNLTAIPAKLKVFPLLYSIWYLRTGAAKLCPWCGPWFTSQGVERGIGTVLLTIFSLQRAFAPYGGIERRKEKTFFMIKLSRWVVDNAVEC